MFHWNAAFDNLWLSTIDHRAGGAHLLWESGWNRCNESTNPPALFCKTHLLSLQCQVTCLLRIANTSVRSASILLTHFLILKLEAKLNELYYPIPACPLVVVLRLIFDIRKIMILSYKRLPKCTQCWDRYFWSSFLNWIYLWIRFGQRYLLFSISNAV